jgi:CHASE3 domain sensor protein
MLQMINDAFTMSGSDGIQTRRAGSAIVDAAEQGMAMHEPGDTTLKQKARITAGAVAALVIVGWLAIIAVALMAS